MTERIWDAIVVGAGPAGATIARELARMGCAVLLVDKSPFPRGKVCGCCLNGSAMATLKQLGLGYILADLGAVPLRSLHLSSGHRSARLPLPTGVSLSRSAFDHALVQAAIASGATFLPTVTAKLGTLEDGLSTLMLAPQDVSIVTRLVIAADGLNGRLMAPVGERQTIAAGSRIGGGAIVDQPPAFYEPGTIYMAVAPSGYVGLVRLEDGRLDVAAAFDADSVRERGGLERAAGSVLKSAGMPAIPSVAWRGTPPLTRTTRRLSGPHWFTVGDAAGYIEPFTGEGMAWALAGAASLAPLAAEAIRSRKWDTRWEQRWETIFQQVIRQRQGTCRLVARFLRSPTLCRVAITVLSRVPRLATPIIKRLNHNPRIIPGL